MENKIKLTNSDDDKNRSCFTQKHNKKAVMQILNSVLLQQISQENLNNITILNSVMIQEKKININQ